MLSSLSHYYNHLLQPQNSAITNPVALKKFKKHRLFKKPQKQAPTYHVNESFQERYLKTRHNGRNG